MKRSTAFKTDKILIPWGDDFYYDDLKQARKLFGKIELLMKSSTDVTVRYATPSEYFAELKKSKVELPTYVGDFLPLVNFKTDRRDLYWTGYYCSKPELKRMIAKALDLARTAKLLSALVLKEDFDTKDADFGLHHDAITGTSRADVDPSYVENAISGINKADRKISEAFEQLSRPDSKEIKEEYRPLVVFNPVNWRRTQLIEVETSSLHVKVLDSALNPVLAQVVQTPQGKYLVLFNASLAGLGFRTFFVIQSDSACQHCAAFSTEVAAHKLSKGSFTVDLDEHCHVKSLVQNGRRLEVNARFYKYTSTDGGAYVFMPDSTGYNVTDIELTSCKVYEGEVAAVAFAEWKRSSSTSEEPYRQRLLIGLYSDSLQWQFEVSPTPGQELFLRMEGETFKDEPWFHTFNSGDLRKRLHKKANNVYVAGMNYYPIAGALVAGKLTEALTIVPQFPTGAGFPTKERNIDLHLHRNMMKDEILGLGEALNDTSVTVHTFHATFGKVTHKELWRKYLTGKHAFQLFSVTSQSPLKLSSKPLKEAGAFMMPWSYSSKAEVGLASGDVYLSSASWRHDHAVVRLLEIAETDVQIDWQNLVLIEERNLGGFDKAKPPVSLAGKEALVSRERRESGYPVALRSKQPDVVVNGFELRGLQAFTADFKLKESIEATQSLKTKRLSAIEVVQVIKAAFIAESPIEGTLVYSVALGLSLVATLSILACTKRRRVKDN
jgi:hypothetical protein